MIVTDASLKTTSACPSSQLHASEQTQVMKVLLDECVTASFNKNKIIECGFAHSKNLVGIGASDDKVMQFAKENGYLLVTIDQKLVTRCIKSGVSVAYYVNGRAHAIAVSQVFEIPYKTKGAPIKVKKIKRRQKQSLFSKLASLLR